MSQKCIPTKLYTRSTRAPLLLWTYRKLLKYCNKLKKIDLPSGEWLKLEIMLNFRKNKSLDKIEDIHNAYLKANSFKGMLQHAIENQDIESQKSLLRLAYGQKGKRYFDFLAAICIANKDPLKFNQVSELYNYDVAIPEEYKEYMEKNTQFQYLYEDLFRAQYDFSKIKEDIDSNQEEIEFLKAFVYKMYKQDCFHAAYLKKNKSRSKFA